MSDYGKKYYQDNKEALREKQREYYQKNKEAILERSRQWQANNPERVKELASNGYMRRVIREEQFPEEKRRRRNKIYKSRYGISLEEYEAIEKDQNMACAICKARCARYEFLSVDHCHETGKVRGLLCHSCNVAIGHFKDSAENLENAVQYMKKQRDLRKNDLIILNSKGEEPNGNED